MYIILKWSQTPAFKVSTNWRKNVCFKISSHKHKSKFLPRRGLPGIKIKMKTHWDWVWKITIQRSGGFNFPWTLRKFYSWTCQNQLHFTLALHWHCSPPTCTVFPVSGVVPSKVSTTSNVPVLLASWRALTAHRGESESILWASTVGQNICKYEKLSIGF